MVERSGNGILSSVKYSADVLDKLIAPECSTVTKCGAPELDELPNYFGSFFLNNILRLEIADVPRPLILVFLRRLTQAFMEYRSGREYLSAYVSVLQQTNNVTSRYLQALAHFEQAVINAYLALLAHNACCRVMVPGSSKIFSKGDNSIADRLASVYNALKHFDGRIVAGTIRDEPAPVWIVNDGLRCHDVTGQLPVVRELRFVELVEVLTDLRGEAKFMSEEVYQQVAASKREGGAP